MGKASHLGPEDLEGGSFELLDDGQYVRLEETCFGEDRIYETILDILPPSSASIAYV